MVVVDEAGRGSYFLGLNLNNFSYLRDLIFASIWDFN